MTPSPRSRFSLYLDLIRWNRPAGWLVLVWPTLSALWLAAGGFPGWHLLAVFVLGTILMRSAGCCINDVADRDFDRHVKRTAQRPITSGQVSVKEALAVGAVLSLISLGLVLTTNGVAVAWSVPALLVTILYPFTKRFFAMPQAVLGIAFNFGIVIAFAAVQGQVPAMAWLLWLGNLFWVLAYDTEYAMVDRDDDLKIGMKTSAITLGGHCGFLSVVPGFLARSAGTACAGRYFLHGHCSGAGPGGVALVADPHAHARGVFSGVSHEPLGGVHAVCRHCGQLPVALMC